MPLVFLCLAQMVYFNHKVKFGNSQGELAEENIHLLSVCVLSIPLPGSPLFIYLLITFVYLLISLACCVLCSKGQSSLFTNKANFII